MGEFAEYALTAAMRHGTPHRAHEPTVGPCEKCPLCPREIGGGFVGMAAHVQSKHGMTGPEARRYVASLRTIAANQENDGG